VKPLTDGDRSDIKGDLQKKVLETERYPRVVFRGRHWQMLSEDASHTRAKLSGDLELHGQRVPLDVDVEMRRTNGAVQVKATTSVVQSQWGIKPFTAFLGALKVADPVQIEVEATVPATVPAG
jgi:polyisoprenoid-binding protein YceI